MSYLKRTFGSFVCGRPSSNPPRSARLRRAHTPSSPAVPHSTSLLSLLSHPATLLSPSLLRPSPPQSAPLAPTPPTLLTQAAAGSGRHHLHSADSTVPPGPLYCPSSCTSWGHGGLTPSPNRKQEKRRRGSRWAWRPGSDLPVRFSFFPDFFVCSGSSFGWI